MDERSYKKVSFQNKMPAIWEYHQGDDICTHQSIVGT